MRTIHRIGAGPGLHAKCGAAGAVKLSITGVLITCPACTGPSTAEIEQRQQQTIKDAAQRFRTKYVVKCDDCKRQIGRTDNLSESAAGGRCAECAA